ncbi:MAG: mechanosensitive ion channel family protein, partial [Nitrospirota bacterium]|nr:mechanosensitive ion channel family protein [Nitrospirota bacterium]
AKRWRLPETEIDIVLIEDGPRAGEYLVSAQTVARLPDFFERVKDLPYKPGPAKALYNVYRALSSVRIRNLYDFYLNSPVRLIDIVPLRWLLRLPKWASAQAAGVAAWQWLGLGFGLAAGLIVILAANRAARRLARRKQIDPGIGWHRLLTPLAVILVTGFLIPRVNFIFHIGGDPLIFIAYALTTVLFLSATWVALIGGNILGETIVMSRNLRQRSMDSQLIRLGTRFASLIIAIGFLIEGANQLGLPAYSVLAGLGVGGFAVALAARESLANLLGSIVIIFERPFRVGHWIKIGDTEGTVEDVGFRSIRIRTFYNSLISIPNNEVVNAVIDNLGRRRMRRQRFFVQIRYDTPREKVEQFINGINRLITDHPMIEKDDFHIRFNGFGESGLDILVYFYLHVPTYFTELEERERILLQILDLAKEIDIEFAFPTRTLHVETVPEAAKPEDVKIG